MESQENSTYSREIGAISGLLIAIGFILLWFISLFLEGVGLTGASQFTRVHIAWAAWKTFLGLTTGVALYFLARSDSATGPSQAERGKLITGMIGAVFILISLFELQREGLGVYELYVSAWITITGFVGLIVSSRIPRMSTAQVDRLKIRLPRLLAVSAALIALYYLGNSTVHFVTYNWKVDSFPFSVDYGEGPILDQVMRLSKFQNIYTINTRHLPFTITNYPPVYPLIQVPFAWIFGPAFWYGRIISTLSVIAAAVFIALILAMITRDRLAALLGGLTLLAIPYILGWSPYCRVDALALGLSLGGVFVITRWPDTRKGVIVAGLLLTAAVYTRQSYALAAPPAAFFWLIGNRRWKQALRLVGWVAGIGLGLLLALVLATRGGFYFNIVTANINPFYWSTVRDYKNAIWQHMRYFVIGGLAFLAFGWRVKNKIWWLAAPYLIGGTISALTVGKAGSSFNYLYELSAGISLVAGAVIAAPTHRFGLLKIPLILILAWQVDQINQWTNRDYSWLPDRVNNQRADIQQMVNLLHQAKGPVLADEFMGLVVLDGRRLAFQPFEFKQLAITGRWDETPFIQDIQNHVFGMILLYAPKSWDSRHERWTQAQLDAIQDNYHSIGSYAETYVLVPNP